MIAGAGPWPGSGWFPPPGRRTRVWNEWQVQVRIQRGTELPSPGRAGSRADPTHTHPQPLYSPNLPRTRWQPLAYPIPHDAEPWLAGQGPRPGTTGSSRGLGVAGRTGGNATAHRRARPPAPGPPGGNGHDRRRVPRSREETCRWTDGRSHPNPAGTGMEVCG